MSVLDRVGRIGDVPVRLAKFRPVEGRYQRRLSPVSPSEGFIAGDQFQLNAVPDTQVWNINEWSGGEGNDLFLEDERDVYHRSNGVRPRPTGEGLILGALGELTKDSGGVDDFADGTRFGYGNLPPTNNAVLWVGFDQNAYEWHAAGEERWGVAVSTGVVGTFMDITSMVMAGGQNAAMFSGHYNGDIQKWTRSAQSTHYADFSNSEFPAVVASFGATLYALNGDDLNSVNVLTANQRTLVFDNEMADRGWANTTEAWRRISSSDKGPIWIRRTVVGQTDLFEYNVGTSAGGIIGTIPHNPSYPYSVAFSQGVYFVGYRNTYVHGAEGDAFLYVQRGDSRSVVPIRSISGSTAQKRVLTAGLLGSDLIIYFDGAVWAYNLDTGGVYMVGTKQSAGEPTDVAIADSSVFLAGVGGGAGFGSGKKVERIRLDRYVSSGTIESGRFDVRYPGLPKLLTEVTVMTEPLPAGTSVEVAVSSDGGAYVALTGAHDVDGATSHTFVGSTPSASIIGREFELKLTLNGTSTATPTVRSVAAVVTGAAHLEEWVMEIDCSDIDSVGGQAGWDVIDRLRGLAASQQVVTFTNPWEQRGIDGADQIPVRVLDVILPQGERRDAYATVRVRRTQMVVAA